MNWKSSIPASRWGLQNSVVHEKRPRWSKSQSLAPPLTVCFGPLEVVEDRDRWVAGQPGVASRRSARREGRSSGSARRGSLEHGRRWTPLNGSDVAGDVRGRRSPGRARGSPAPTSVGPAPLLGLDRPLHREVALRSRPPRAARPDRCRSCASALPRGRGRTRRPRRRARGGRASAALPGAASTPLESGTRIIRIRPSPSRSSSWRPSTSSASGQGRVLERMNRGRSARRAPGRRG